MNTRVPLSHPTGTRCVQHVAFFNLQRMHCRRAVLPCRGILLSSPRPQRVRSRVHSDGMVASVEPGSTADAEGFEYVFSYGSNSTTQLRERVRKRGPAFLVQPAVMRGYSRIFAGWSSRWSGSVASVHPCEGQQVAGLVVQLTLEELETLDEYEGQYTRTVHTFYAGSGQPVKAWIYIKDSTAYQGPPSEEYLTAIHRMLTEGGHSTLIKVSHVGDDGDVVHIGDWSLEESSTSTQ